MKDEITIRTYHPGDPSLVCYFQYKLYEEQYHFNGFYEKEMLGGMAELYDDLKGSQMWIAELDGKIVGDIAVIKKGPDSARLRWFGVGASLQGQGLGSRLLTTALDFCREKGYIHLSLSTLDILKPARHLYRKFGFQRTGSEFYNEWDESRKIHQEIWAWELGSVIRPKKE